MKKNKGSQIDSNCPLSSKYTFLPSMTTSAMSTVAAALKRFASFLIFDHTADCKPYNSRYDCQYNCCSHVINSLQFKLLFSLYFIFCPIPQPYFTAFAVLRTSIFKESASLYGLNRRYRKPITRSNATIVPIPKPPPVNSVPS